MKQINYNNIMIPRTTFYCKNLWSKFSLVFLSFGVTLATGSLYQGGKINKKDNLPGILKVVREDLAAEWVTYRCGTTKSGLPGGQRGHRCIERFWFFRWRRAAISLRANVTGVCGQFWESSGWIEASTRIWIGCIQTMSEHGLSRANQENLVRPGWDQPIRNFKIKLKTTNLRLRYSFIFGFVALTFLQILIKYQIAKHVCYSAIISMLFVSSWERGIEIGCLHYIEPKIPQKILSLSRVRKQEKFMTKENLPF